MPGIEAWNSLGQDYSEKVQNCYWNIHFGIFSNECYFISRKRGSFTPEFFSEKVPNISVSFSDNLICTADNLNGLTYIKSSYSTNLVKSDYIRTQESQSNLPSTRHGILNRYACDEKGSRIEGGVKRNSSPTCLRLPFLTTIRTAFSVYAVVRFSNYIKWYTRNYLGKGFWTLSLPLSAAWLGWKVVSVILVCKFHQEICLCAVSLPHSNILSSRERRLTYATNVGHLCFYNCWIRIVDILSTVVCLREILLYEGEWVHKRVLI